MVILGAGFDSRAYRIPGVERARVFGAGASGRSGATTTPWARSRSASRKPWQLMVWAVRLANGGTLSFSGQSPSIGGEEVARFGALALL